MPDTLSIGSSISSRRSSNVSWSDESVKSNDSDRTSIRRFLREQPLPDSQMQILANELSLLATALFNISAGSDEERADFFRSLKGVRVMEIAAKHPEIRDAINAAASLDPAAFVSLGERCYELGKIYSLMSDSSISVEPDGIRVRLEPLSQQQPTVSVHDSATPLLDARQPIRATRWDPDKSDLSNIQAYILNTPDAKVTDLRRFATNDGNIIDPKEIVKEAENSMIYGAKPELRIQVLALLKQRGDRLERTEIEALFNGSEKGSRVHHRPLPVAIFASARNYFFNKKNSDQLTLEALGSSMRGIDLLAFEAFLKKPEGFVALAVAPEEMKIINIAPTQDAVRSPLPMSTALTTQSPEPSVGGASESRKRPNPTFASADLPPTKRHVWMSTDERTAAIDPTPLSIHGMEMPYFSLQPDRIALDPSSELGSEAPSEFDRPQRKYEKAGFTLERSTFDSEMNSVGNAWSSSMQIDGSALTAPVSDSVLGNGNAHGILPLQNEPLASTVATPANMPGDSLIAISHAQQEMNPLLLPASAELFQTADSSQSAGNIESIHQ